MEIIPAPRAVRETITQRPHDTCSQSLRQRSRQGTPAFLYHVVRVTGEQLVAAISRQGNGDVIAREFGNHERRYRGRIGEWFVKVPDEIVDDVADLWGNEELVMVRAQFLRSQSRVLEFVVTVLMKSDRKRLDRLVHVLRHQGNDG